MKKVDILQPPSSQSRMTWLLVSAQRCLGVDPSSFLASREQRAHATISLCFAISSQAARRANWLIGAMLRPDILPWRGDIRCLPLSQATARPLISARLATRSFTFCFPVASRFLMFEAFRMSRYTRIPDRGLIQSGGKNISGSLRGGTRSTIVSRSAMEAMQSGQES